MAASIAKSGMFASPMFAPAGGPFGSGVFALPGANMHTMMTPMPFQAVMPSRPWMGQPVPGIPMSAPGTGPVPSMGNPIGRPAGGGPLIPRMPGMPTGNPIGRPAMPGDPPPGSPPTGNPIGAPAAPPPNPFPGPGAPFTSPTSSNPFASPNLPSWLRDYATPASEMGIPLGFTGEAGGMQFINGHVYTGEGLSQDPNGAGYAFRNILTAYGIPMSQAPAGWSPVNAAPAAGGRTAVNMPITPR